MASFRKNEYETMRRILILSDDSLRRDVVQMALTGLPAFVRCAADDRQAAALCDEEEGFDLAIVLGAAPFLRGSDAIERLRGRQKRSRTTLFAVVWQHDEESVMRVVEAGADQCFGFPVSLHRLRRKVSEHLNRLGS